MLQCQDIRITGTYMVHSCFQREISRYPLYYSYPLYYEPPVSGHPRDRVMLSAYSGGVRL